MNRVGDLFSIRRRFKRSVNLERDGDSPEGLEGYVLTPRNVELLERIVSASEDPHRTRAWTFTGVYGTGKSSFANFLSAAFARRGTPVQRAASHLLQEAARSDLETRIGALVPSNGGVRAVVTAKREPLQRAILRGLARGSERFWSHRRGRNPKVVERLLEVAEESEIPGSWDIAAMIGEVARAADAPLLLVIDELGKVLEHAARTRGEEDLYLLQRIAELPSGPGDAPVLVVGLLHQAFTEYGQMLSSAEQAEWGKIQGRFEDVAFAEPADQMLRIVGRAIQFEGDEESADVLMQLAEDWSSQVVDSTRDYVADVLGPARIFEVFPLHPVVALVLPTLCARYGQNERSLFTFMASGEPHSLVRFFETEHAETVDQLPLLRLPTVFDYFVDVASVATTSSVHMGRWSEINSVVRDAEGLPQAQIDALKTVGTLNLVASGGPLRASKGLVQLALSRTPEHVEDGAGRILADLVQQGLLTYRQQVDEYRIWQGSDFDIDGAVREKMEAEQRSLAKVLQSLGSPAPSVAQRHSYQTGSLRYFERRFAGQIDELESLELRGRGSSGLVVHWVGQEGPGTVPECTRDGLPLVVLIPAGIEPLASAANELSALLKVEKSAAALQADGVGRRELKKRVALAREVFDRAMNEAFDLSAGAVIWADGQVVERRNFTGLLSDLLDRYYRESPVLWNEIINRRDLTSQGARAQRQLITALLQAWNEPRLGIEGTGPDYSIYASVLEASGIHRLVDDTWVVGPPTDSEDVALSGAWGAVEEFCLNSVEKPRGVKHLYETLAAPPYGVMNGLIPVLLAAVLIHRSEDVSIYQEGSFVPVLTPAHFELLVKRPEKFSVKHFELGDVQFSEYRRVLERLGGVKSRRLKGARNESLLAVVRPLVQFAVSLPQVTQRSRSLDERSRAVRDTLLGAREPDTLVFSALPEACGFEPFVPGEQGASNRRRRFLRALADTLSDLQTHYERLLNRCEGLLHQAFAVKRDTDKLREDLRVRASYLVGSVIEPQLNSFVVAASDDEKNRREWLEALVMVVADRPAENWADDDVSAFEMNLAELARRFRNIEALHAEVAAAPREGFEARRVAITSQAGRHTDRVVWMDPDAKEGVSKRAQALLSELDDISESHLREAIVVKMLETLLGRSGEGRSNNLRIDEKGEEKHA